MSWNKKRSGTSLKFKLTLTYALLFSVSSLLIFVLFTRVARGRFLQEGDNNALTLGRDLQRIFFVGGKNNPLGEFVPLEELPENRRAVLEQRFPGAVPIYLYRTTGEHGRYYTCYMIRSGECYEVQLSGGEVIFSRRLNPAEGENRLKRSWRQHLLASGRENSFCLSSCCTKSGDSPAGGGENSSLCGTETSSISVPYSSLPFSRWKSIGFRAQYQ